QNKNIKVQLYYWELYEDVCTLRNVSQCLLDAQCRQSGRPGRNPKPPDQDTGDSKQKSNDAGDLTE
ncbi:MAG: hypothetical protein ABI728_12090, partial [Betaproteobacteria bacterium]